MPIRPAAVAGTWYPRTAEALLRDVEAYVSAASVTVAGRIHGVVAPHAGLMFSGPVAAYAYKAAAAGPYDVAFLVGPSHFVGFDGVAVWPDGAFESPLGPMPVDAVAAAELLALPMAHDLPSAHGREHCLEMQIPFLRRLLPGLSIVPIVIGYQTRETIEALAVALAASARERQALLIASTDLSHYFDAETAATLDGRVQTLVDGFDPDGLLDLFEQYPEEDRGRYVACGGGAAIAVMLASRLLGARQGRVLQYAHSGEVSGDHAHVVGYLAAAFGTFDDAD